MTCASNTPPISSEELQEIKEKKQVENIFCIYANTIFLLESWSATKLWHQDESGTISFIENIINDLSISNLTYDRIYNNLIVSYQSDIRNKTVGVITCLSRKTDSPAALSGVAILLSLIENIRYKTPHVNLKCIFSSDREAGIPNGLAKILSRGELDVLEYGIVLEPANHQLAVNCSGNFLHEDIKKLIEKNELSTSFQQSSCNRQQLQKRKYLYTLGSSAVEQSLIDGEPIEPERINKIITIIYDLFSVIHEAVSKGIWSTFTGKNTLHSNSKR